jgi:hypothetical protein
LPLDVKQRWRAILLPPSVPISDSSIRIFTDDRKVAAYSAEVAARN